ncbi:hypothetical protein BDV95DRAFT_578507 [Massariosphaeria phaeospora]|uniref:Uncharacterized protein n=1 Tax=Massariosphaeria phaeospora TaxID=100035 RepID=A0A7C8I2J4_9PLEO|nr:hypothetical protein BDV95DRAFT_578507 [Massariosphaeria phaeospora]
MVWEDGGNGNERYACVTNLTLLLCTVRISEGFGLGALCTVHCTSLRAEFQIYHGLCSVLFNYVYVFQICICICFLASRKPSRISLSHLSSHLISHTPFRPPPLSFFFPFLPSPPVNSLTSFPSSLFSPTTICSSESESEASELGYWALV